jgi:hypothetical protein
MPLSRPCHPLILNITCIQLVICGRGRQTLVFWSGATFGAWFITRCYISTSSLIQEFCYGAMTAFPTHSASGILTPKVKSMLPNQGRWLQWHVIQIAWGHLIDLNWCRGVMDLGLMVQHAPYFTNPPTAAVWTLPCKCSNRITCENGHSSCRIIVLHILGTGWFTSLWTYVRFSLLT